MTYYKRIKATDLHAPCMIIDGQEYNIVGLIQTKQAVHFITDNEKHGSFKLDALVCVAIPTTQLEVIETKAKSLKIGDLLQAGDSCECLEIADIGNNSMGDRLVCFVDGSWITLGAASNVTVLR